MGSQIACDFALGGHRTVLLTRDPVRARATIDRHLAMARTHRLAPAERVDEAASLLEVRRGTADPECELAVESLPEQTELKATALRGVARTAPGAVLATNTSSLSITRLGEAVGEPERTIGAHYWNPPLLMPLVEVTAGERTAAEAVDRVVDALRPTGKIAVRVHKDVPGFIWNRLQLAVLREAVALVEGGVATAETVDIVMRLGLARRWRHTGPFETVALGGTDTFVQAARNILPALSAVTELDALGDHVSIDAASLEATAVRRDEALARELAAEARRAR